MAAARDEKDRGDPPSRLSVRAVDAEDIAFLGACLQDALVSVEAMRFLPDEGRFILLLNRFRWEGVHGAGERSGSEPYERVHCGLSIAHVRRVQSRGFHPDTPEGRGRIMEVLAMAAADDAVVLHFAGGAALRLEVTETEILARDLDEPWPTLWQPCHEDDGKLEPDGNPR